MKGNSMKACVILFLLILPGCTPDKGTTPVPSPTIQGEYILTTEERIPNAVVPSNAPVVNGEPRSTPTLYPDEGRGMYPGERACGWVGDQFYPSQYEDELVTGRGTCVAVDNLTDDQLADETGINRD